ncbi:YbbR-like domain-containing protein [Candidatus Deferrimicrobium sp.]|uniref:CdaR family protein n=1 Tax=Candidatus Deferrimicrobium sp. TaxID=3060586 RepID=UPI00271594CF|nr:CdaR family protein [Candidatus Deferrimicrobium sp.]MDO8737754.1 CdaR family protein [Candidatus Deferrimicrobium sp.]
MSAADIFRVLRRLASQNLGLKVVALVLAMAAWWFVAGESKVLVSFTIPLEIRNVPKGMTITNKAERQVEVRLSGPSSLLSGMRPSEISAAVDLAAGRAGRQYFTLDDRAVKIPPGIKVQRIFPSSIEVTLDRTERRTVPVSARIGGGTAVRRRVAKVEIDPPSVEVEALPEEFSRIRSVYTEEIVPDVDGEAFATTARVELREPHAKIIGSPSVRVKIQFRK